MICRKCKLDKPDTDFYRSFHKARQKSYLQRTCKACALAPKSHQMPETKECSSCQITFWHPEANFPKRAVSPDGLGPCCKTCKARGDKKYYKKNSAKIIAQVTQHQIKNRDKVNTWRRKYQSEKIKNDTQFRMQRILRRRLYNVLQELGAKKSGSAVDQIGCSVSELVTHIESLFQPGMSWENYGFGCDKWHIDHIQPLVEFDLEDPDQLRAACHYTNLQPLWQVDNLKKAARCFEIGTGKNWLITDKGDPEVRALADQHYSRRTIGSSGFARPGHNLVLVTPDGLAAWVVHRTAEGVLRRDGREVWECTLFANRGPSLSSNLVREAVAATHAIWGDPPNEGLITFVDGDQVKTNIKGYCFRRAGWRHVGDSVGGLLLFRAPAPNVIENWRSWNWKLGRGLILRADLERDTWTTDAAVRAVSKCLTDELRRPPWRGSENLLAGHCYVASEALYHLLGDKSWTPQFVRHEGAPHWFLKNLQSGEVLDITASQFSTPVPYELACGKGFLTSEPSSRAQIVLDRVRGLLAS